MGVWFKYFEPGEMIHHHPQWIHFSFADIKPGENKHKSVHKVKVVRFCFEFHNNLNKVLRS